MKTWIEASKVYLERRVLVIFLLGFSSGLPLLLVYSTLSAWLKESDVSLTMIGLFSWASTAYALKFLWAPLVDKIPVPVLSAWLGQRRSWLVLSQGMIVVTMIGLGGTEPQTALWSTALWAVLLAFASATQDIAIDAYRIESLPADQLGAGSANYVFGYRVAMLVAGAGALFIADGFGWFWAYVAMACLMAVGLATVLLNPEPTRALPESTSDNVGLWAQINDAVLSPFLEFMGRPHWLMILLFVALYKYGEALLGVMANPFYLDIGFSKSEIAAISKGYGFAMTLLGGFAGGVLVARYGIMKALLYAGILQCVANLAFAAQAMVGYSLPMLAVTISIENLTAGMATTAFVAYMSSLCNVAYTATQFALLSSMMAFARTIFASGGGWLADHMDWTSYFVVTTFAAVPGLLVLVWLIKRLPIEKPT